MNQQLSDSCDINRKWFAVRIKPRQENLAVTHYIRQGFKVYLPEIETTRRHARKIEKVQRPLFPGYLFLHLAEEDMYWTRIASTIGAIEAVHFGDCYPPVPDWIIEGIRERENGRGYISMHTLGARVLTAGKKVTVNLGEQDIEGTFLKFRDKERVVILLNMLKRQLPVTAPLSCVKSQ